MISTRLAGVPIDHVRAELAAFPIASEAAFRLNPALTSLDPAMGNSTERLWRSAGTELLGGFPSFSLDEFVAIRDRIWFPHTTHAGGLLANPNPLHQFLRSLARSVLLDRGSIAIPAAPAESGNRVRDPAGLGDVHARQYWRWMSFALPPDLLLGGLGNSSRGPARVEALSARIAAMLGDAGFAESHLHVGAGLDFGTYWVLALNTLGDPGFGSDSLRSPGAVLGEGRKLPLWLLHAALARAALGAYLGQGVQLADFGTFLDGEVGPAVARDEGESSRAVLMLALVSLMRGRRHPESGSYADLQALCRALTPTRSLDLNQYGDDIHRADPLAMSLLSRDRRTPETMLVTAALEYMSGPGSGDALFAGVFWQYVRVRCLLYRHVTQRPLTPGLQWFVRFYARSSPLRRQLHIGTQLEIASKLGGAGAGLRYLEIRTSPESSVADMADMVRRLETRVRDWNLRGDATPEMGLVLHFTKDRGGGSREGRPRGHGMTSNGDPGSQLAEAVGTNATGYRFSDYYKARRTEAIAFERLLLTRPWSLETIRGIDVCADELGVPNWVLAPLVRRVQHAGRDAAAILARDFGAHVPAMRTTAHVGEDFVHLLTGLRNIEEAVEAYQIRDGDRLGHALALGVDPAEWAARAGRIPMPREERLWDLVYVWECSTRRSGARLGQWMAPVEHEISRISDDIFGSPLAPYELLWMRRALTDWRRLYDAGFPDGPVPASGDRRIHLMVRYLTEPELYSRGRHVDWYDPLPEAGILEEIQRSLRQALGRLGIAVEVNPTSNLLVGNLGDLKRHPLWRLNPPVEDATHTPPMLVCIGSDDPLVFASDLRQEYQWVADALAMADLSTAQVAQFLEGIRRVGVESRFTIPPTAGRPALDEFFTLDEPTATLLI